MRPVNRSVIAKQESRMFLLLCRLGRRFTTKMTNKFNRTVKGQARRLIIMWPTVKLKLRWTLCVSFSMAEFKIFLGYVCWIKIRMVGLAENSWSSCRVFESLLMTKTNQRILFFLSFEEQPLGQDLSLIWSYVVVENFPGQFFPVNKSCVFNYCCRRYI